MRLRFVLVRASREVGAPLRPYRARNRIKRVVRILAEEGDLTTAAHSAGFYDSAHFSRSFKNMFGLPPSLIFQRPVEFYFAPAVEPLRIAAKL